MKNGYIYQNRIEAGKILADLLKTQGILKGVILSLPRGGTVVAGEIARVLAIPHDLIITRKIGAPYNPEIAIGSLTQEGQLIQNQDLIEALEIPLDYINEQVEVETKEIKRRLWELRGAINYPEISGEVIILVDDGVATGFTLEAAIRSVKLKKPSKIIVAVPVGPLEEVKRIAEMVDQVVCPNIPERFRSVGAYYQDFNQIDDLTVKQIITENQAP